jgi:hypothetical protein
MLSQGERESGIETTPHPAQLRSLEGRHVSLALTDGSRIDDVELVSAGRPPLETIWVVVSGMDTFLSVSQVLAAWEPFTHRDEAA